MAKFCGNCGAQLEDSAKICGYCGTPLAEDGQTSGVQYETPEQQAKKKKKLKLILSAVAAVLVVVIAVSIVSGFVGYKGAVRKIMNAYGDYDMDTILDMVSDVYYCMGVDDYAESIFSSAISNDLDRIEDQVGSKYKLSYEIVDSYEMSERKYNELMENLEDIKDFDPDTISKVLVVKLELTAKSGNRTNSRSLELILTKENGDWRLLYLN